MFYLIQLLKHSLSEKLMINSFEQYSVKFLSSLLLFAITVFSLYIHVFGKITPGGGFQAGAILGSGIIMYQMLNNIHILSKRALDIITFFGVAIYIGTGIVGIISGGVAFEYQQFHQKYGHIMGIMSVETGVLLVVTTSMVRISNIMSSA